MSNVPRPRSPVPTGHSEPLETPTGDTYQDLIMVLATAGAFGLVLAIEALVFVIAVRP